MWAFCSRHLNAPKYFRAEMDRMSAQLQAVVEENERCKQELAEAQREADQKHWDKQQQLQQNVDKSASIIALNTPST